MDIQMLRNFLALTREKSISKAAKKLYMTQPNLSRQLTELEKEVGCTLFIRSTRRIELTDEGRYFRRQAQKLIDLEEQTLQTLGSLGDIGRDTIRIVLDRVNCPASLVQAIGLMHTRYPAMRFEVKHASTDILAALLDEGTADFALMTEPAPLRKIPHLALPERRQWGLLMRNDASLARLDRIRASDLKDIPLICPGRILKENWLSGWLPQGYGDLHIVVLQDMVDAPEQLVLAEVGYALCACIPGESFHGAGVCFRPLSPSLESRSYLAWKEDGEHRPAKDEFLAVLKSEIEG